MRAYSLAIITNPKGEFLLQLRGPDAPTVPNHWAFFGGHAEKGETPLMTVIRELNEELALTFDPERLIHLSTFPNPDDEGAHTSLYRLTITDEEQWRIRLGEGVAYRFFPSLEATARIPVVEWEREALKRFL